MKDRLDQSDREFEARTKAAFDASVSGLDAATHAKLTRARRRAIDALDAPPLMSWRSARVPQAALAGVLLAAVSAWLMFGQEEPIDQDFETIATERDLELLLDGEELEMFEDLDFYAWLEEQPELQGVAGNENGSG